MVQVLGVVAGVLSISHFITSLFDPSTKQVCVFKLAVGLNGPPGLDDETKCCDGGVVASVTLRDQNDQLIMSKGGKTPHADPGRGHSWFEIHDGDIKTLRFDQGNIKPAAYVEVAGDHNDICIAMISISWAGDTGSYGWVGDWGKHCGLEWYYSNYNVDDSDRQPYCVWLDRDTESGINTTAIKIHMPSFTPDSNYSTNADDFCGGTAFQAYDTLWRPKFQTLANGTGAGPLKAPAGRPSRPDTKGRLWISTNNVHHNATELCLSPTSRGPSLVSIPEGKYCNMDTSEVLPLCGGNITAYCFDVDTRTERGQLTQNELEGKAERGKVYTDVVVLE